MNIDPQRAVDPQQRCRVHGGPIVPARLKAQVDDFFVAEVLGFEPDGAGNHWLVQVEKRDKTTAMVIDWLSKTTGTPRRNIGVCGQKDRFAITQQWFSLPIETFDELEFRQSIPPEGIAVLQIARHGKKLRPGTHQANRFVVRLTEINATSAQWSELEQRVAAVSTQGFANYFGLQRYGRGGDNLTRIRFFGQDDAPKPKRNQRKWLLSSFRSWVFDTLLDYRLQAPQGLAVMPGDICKHHDSNSRFSVTAADITDVRHRIEQGELQLTGPLWGADTLLSSQKAADWEQKAADAVFAQAGEARWVQFLREWKASHDRRALIVRPNQPIISKADPEQGVLTLDFALPPGCYATELVAEIVDTEAPRPDA